MVALTYGMSCPYARIDPIALQATLFSTIKTSFPLNGKFIKIIKQNRNPLSDLKKWKYFLLFTFGGEGKGRYAFIFKGC